MFLFFYSAAILLQLLRRQGDPSTEGDEEKISSCVATVWFMDIEQEVIDFSSVGGQLGENTWKEQTNRHQQNPNQDGWAGLGPPPTKTRKYCFRLYALNVESLSPALNRTRSADFKTNNGSKILQEAEICGTVSNT